MKDEITRTSSADRERYIRHLPELYARGIITSQEELDVMSGRILQATYLHELDAVLAEMPKPPRPRRPRDMGVPGNFLPACAFASLVGVTLAVIPTAMMSGHHGALANTVVVFALAWGAWIVCISIIAACAAGIMWDNLDNSEQRDRRARDQQGR